MGKRERPPPFMTMSEDDLHAQIVAGKLPRSAEQIDRANMASRFSLDPN